MEAEKQVMSGSTSSLKNGAMALSAAAEYLETVGQTVNKKLADAGIPSVDLDFSLSEYLKGDASVMETKLKEIEERMAEINSKITNQFKDHTELGYRLQAVFFHRGGYGHGHYWTYIRDFQNDVWRIYNDEKVELFTNLADIYDAETWQQGTPTYAVYVRDDVKTQYAEAVHRVFSTAVPEPVDEIMQDQARPEWDTNTLNQY